MLSHPSRYRVVVRVAKSKANNVVGYVGNFEVIDHERHPVIVIHDIAALAIFGTKEGSANKRGSACHAAFFKVRQVRVRATVKNVVHFCGPVREKAD